MIMVVGYMFGDGWLSNGTSCKQRKKPVKRKQICFSIHPESDDSWIYKYLKEKGCTNNIKLIEKFSKSKLVKNGGISKKITINDYKLYDHLLSKGCPTGRKGEIERIDIDISDLNFCKNFLTGIYSAEGCIYTSKGRQISIQIGMNNKIIIDFTKKILDKLEIKYTYFINGKTYRLFISDFYEISKCLDIFDFRLDSRKQEKYILVGVIIKKSIENLKERKKRVEIARNLYEKGISLKNIRKEIKECHHRWFDKNYTPLIRWST
jgi:hypothetical protein